MFYKRNLFSIGAACIAGLSVLLSSAGAAEASPDLLVVDINAEVFNEKNINHLCRASGERRIVDRVQLAEELARVANVKFELRDQANPGGIRDGKISDNEKLRYIASEAPFGDSVTAYKDDALSALRDQYGLRASLDQWFLIGPPSTSKFRVVPAQPTVDEYFADNSPYEIVCPDEKKRDAGGKKQVSSEKASPDLLEGFDKSLVIRKGVSDMKIPKGKLTKANGASVSFVRDRENAKDTYSVEGLVGVIIAGTSADKVEKMRPAVPGAPQRDESPHPWWSLNLAPYIFHKRIDQRPDSKSSSDINYAQPGLTANFAWISATGDVAFDLQGDGNIVLDAEHDARYWTANAVLAPSFIDNGTIIFGAPLVLGPVAIRPTLALVAGAFVIEDAGTNKELLNKDTFASLGFDAATDLFLVGGSSVLTNFKLQLAYNYRHNTGSVVDVSTFAGLVSYTPPGQDNLTIDFGYVKGRDLKTFQDQDRWTASLGFRY